MQNLAIDLQTQNEGRERLGGIQEEVVMGNASQMEEVEPGNVGRKNAEELEDDGLGYLRCRRSSYKSSWFYSGNEDMVEK